MMHKLLVITLTALHGTIYTLSYTVDPCDPCTYLPLPRPTTRGSGCNTAISNIFNDGLLHHSWYRAITNDGDLSILTDPVNTLWTCGTKFPYWMNGTHPDKNDDIVNRTACQTVVHTSRCVDIQVKNCTDYFVYQLPQLASHEDGYCFDSNRTCNSGTLAERQNFTFNNGTNGTCDWQIHLLTDEMTTTQQTENGKNDVSCLRYHWCSLPTALLLLESFLVYQFCKLPFHEYIMT